MAQATKKPSAKKTPAKRVPKPTPAPPAPPATYRPDPDVPMDFIADGIRYTVRVSAMTPSIDRQMYRTIGMSAAALEKAWNSDAGELWMFAAWAYLAELQAGQIVTLEGVEERFPYDREIEFEMWPAIDGDAPEAEGVRSSR